MHHRSRGWLGLAMLAALATQTPAQVRVADWPKVQLELVGTDKAGNPLTTLTPDALAVQEDQKPVKLDALEKVAGPISVCLMLDTSGSMYDRKAAMVEAARHLIATLPPDDEICIMDFAWEGFLDQKLTLDRALALKALTYVKASGGTAMYDSMVAVSSYMRKNARNPSRVIVLFSDGDDNASKTTEPDFWKAMQTPGSPVVHIIRVPGPHHGNESGSENSALAFTRRLGGFSYFPKDAKDLEASVDHWIESLSSRYLLTYESEDTVRDGRERRVDVGLDKLHQKAKDVVRAPEGYYAPTQ